MDALSDYAHLMLSRGIDRTWNWFNTLSREEWLVVMAIACLLGFAMLRGFGIRKNG